MCKYSASSADVAVAACKKNVRFQEETLEERFELQISDQEKTATWMTRADFRAIHADVRQAVQESVVLNRMRDGDDQSEKCFRGLEPIISSYRRVEIQAFIQDMLEMQEECKILGIPGWMGLQCFSENNSKPALKRALQLADQDASEARRVYAEAFMSQRQ